MSPNLGSRNWVLNSLEVIDETVKSLLIIADLAVTVIIDINDDGRHWLVKGKDTVVQCFFITE